MREELGAVGFSALLAVSNDTVMAKRSGLRGGSMWGQMRKIAAQVQDSAIRERRSFFVKKTIRRRDEVVELAQRCAAAGFHVECDPDAAWQRVQRRDLERTSSLQNHAGRLGARQFSAGVLGVGWGDERRGRGVAVLAGAAAGEAWRHFAAQGSKQLIHIHFTYACYNPSTLA